MNMPGGRGQQNVLRWILLFRRNRILLLFDNRVVPRGAHRQQRHQTSKATRTTSVVDMLVELDEEEDYILFITGVGGRGEHEAEMAKTSKPIINLLISWGMSDIIMVAPGGAVVFGNFYGESECRRLQ